MTACCAFLQYAKKQKYFESQVNLWYFCEIKCLSFSAKKMETKIDRWQILLWHRQGLYLYFFQFKKNIYKMNTLVFWFTSPYFVYCVIQKPFSHASYKAMHDRQWHSPPLDCTFPRDLSFSSWNLQLLIFFAALILWCNLALELFPFTIWRNVQIRTINPFSNSPLLD